MAVTREKGMPGVAGFRILVATSLRPGWLCESVEPRLMSRGFPTPFSNNFLTSRRSRAYAKAAENG
jgi:hypothetical protein